MPHRRCIKCKTFKDQSEFSSYSYITGSGNRSIRFESRCKLCNRIRRMERYSDPDKKAIDMETSLNWKHNNKKHLHEYQKSKQSLPEYKALKALLQRRRAAKIRAGTRDKDSDQIKDIYKMAKELEVKTGIKHHVDHILSIKNGGLHVIENLQILTATENLRKGAGQTRLAIAITEDRKCHR